LNNILLKLNCRFWHLISAILIHAVQGIPHNKYLELNLNYIDSLVFGQQCNIHLYALCMFGH
jgi:hypothetical protein